MYLLSYHLQHDDTTAEMEYYRKNIVSEPESTVSGEPSLRIRFCLPVAADQGKAPERIVRRFRTANSFQVRLEYDDIVHHNA